MTEHNFFHALLFIVYKVFIHDRHFNHFDLIKIVLKKLQYVVANMMYRIL